MAQEGERLHRLTLAFEDPALEQAYLAASAEESRRQYLLGFGVSAAVVGLLALTDRAAVPADALGVIAAARYLTVLPALAGPVALALLAGPETFRRWSQPLGGLAGAVAIGNVLVAGAALGAAGVVPTDALVQYGTTAVVIGVIGVQTMMALRFAVATLATVPVSALYVAAGFAEGGRPALAVYVTVWTASANALGMTGSYMLERLRRRSFAQRRALDAERARSEALLRNMLPAPIAARLKADPSHIAEGFAEATVLFADIVGFTTLSARLAPAEVVEMLNRLFTAFDALAERFGLEKIKTIGDAYMVAGGLPERRADHAEAVADMALAMRDAVARVAAETGHPLAVRIGINTGPVVAGVIGRTKFAYDLWGDAVNTASRMESHGLVGEIQITEATRSRLAGAFVLEERGRIPVKGKGELATWLLKARVGAR